MFSKLFELESDHVEMNGVLHDVTILDLGCSEDLVVGVLVSRPNDR